MATYAPLPTQNFDLMHDKRDSVHEGMHKSQNPFLDPSRDTVLLYANGFKDLKPAPIVSEELVSPVSPDTIANISQYSQLPSYFGPEDMIPESPEDSKYADYTCCRCDQKQKLNPSAPVACENCTKAICRKCTINSEEVVSIGKNSRAKLPINGVPGQAWWFCHNCGVKRDVPASKVRLQKDGTASVDLAKLVCEPCNQKACGTCLAVVEIETEALTEEAANEELPRPSIPMRNHHSSMNLRERTNSPPLRTHHSSMHLRNKASINMQSGPNIEVPKQRFQHIRSQPSIQGDDFFHTTANKEIRSREPQTKAEDAPPRTQSSRISMTRLWSMKMVRRWSSR
jgi:hypothetical protein